jgi:hypothetical protein
MGAVVLIVEIGAPVPIFAKSGRSASSSRRRCRWYPILRRAFSRRATATSSWACRECARRETCRFREIALSRDDSWSSRLFAYMSA